MELGAAIQIRVGAVLVAAAVGGSSRRQSHFGFFLPFPLELEGSDGPLPSSLCTFLLLLPFEFAACVGRGEKELIFQGTLGDIPTPLTKSRFVIGVRGPRKQGELAD